MRERKREREGEGGKRERELYKKHRAESLRRFVSSSHLRSLQLPSFVPLEAEACAR